MFISEPMTFHDSIKPLVYLNWFLGIRTFQLSNQNSSTHIFMKLYTVVITLISWTLNCIVLISITQITDYQNATIMAITMRRAVICVNSGFTVIASLLVWLQRKELKDCLRLMPILDNTFQIVLGVKNEYKKQFTRITCQVIAIILAVIVTGIYDTLQSFENVPESQTQLYLASLYVTHHPMLVMLLLDLNFCTFIGYLRRKFRDVNDTLLGLANKPFVSCSGERLFVVSQKVDRRKSKDGVENIETDDTINDKYHLLWEIRKAHLELCKLSRKINLAFGIQNLLSMGISFAVATGLLYTIYSAILLENVTNRKLVEVIGTVIWTSVYISKIWMVNHSCWSLTNEAERTGEVIYELLNTKMDKEFQKEIQEFGIQMLQNPIRFNACGFFTLDYTFVQGVIGSITTYLVILIQMSHVSEVPISDTTFAQNVTEILPHLYT